MNDLFAVETAEAQHQIKQISVQFFYNQLHIHSMIYQKTMVMNAFIALEKRVPVFLVTTLSLIQRIMNGSNDSFFINQDQFYAKFIITMAKLILLINSELESFVVSVDIWKQDLSG